MRPTKNLVGVRFGRLVVEKPDVTRGYWLAECDCGNKKVVRGASLMNGNTKSCGCLTANNPGRPKKPKYTPHVPFMDLVNMTVEHMTPIRNALAAYGVKVKADGTLIYNDTTEKYPNAYIALGAALQKCIRPHEVGSEQNS